MNKNLFLKALASIVFLSVALFGGAAGADEVTSKVGRVSVYGNTVRVAAPGLTLCVDKFQGYDQFEQFLEKARQKDLAVTFTYTRRQWGPQKSQWCGEIAGVSAPGLGSFAIYGVPGHPTETPLAAVANVPAATITAGPSPEKETVSLKPTAPTTEPAAAAYNKLAEVKPPRPAPEPKSDNTIGCDFYWGEGDTTAKAYHLGILLRTADRGALRDRVREQVHEKYCVYLFGRAMDEIEKTLADEFDRQLVSDGVDPKRLKNAPDRTYFFIVRIPANFAVDQMDLRFNVSRSERRLTVHQNFRGREVVVLDVPVALGATGWTTPAGSFWLKRIVKDPYWYPPAWSEQKVPSQPGTGNPYGLWMSELSLDQEPGNHGFAVKRDTGIRVHSTNSPRSIGRYASHGCIRIHPRVANELFPGLLRYLPHEAGQKNGRGIVHPLLYPVPIGIVGQRK